MINEKDILHNLALEYFLPRLPTWTELAEKIEQIENQPMPMTPKENLIYDKWYIDWFRNMEKERRIDDLYIEILQELQEVSNVWLYEKRPWWETVFLYNIYKNDMICKTDLNNLNKPSIWWPRF